MEKSAIRNRASIIAGRLGMTDIAQAIETCPVEELETYLAGIMAAAGMELENLATGFEKLGHKVEAARTQLEALQAQAPYLKIKGSK